MARLSDYRLDPSKLEDGAWFTYHGDIRFRIRRATHPRFVDALRERIRSLRGEFDGNPPAEKVTRATQEETARHLVTGWDGVQSEDSDEHRPFSVDECEKVLTDPLFVDLFVWVESCARQGAAYRQSATERTLGKS